MVCGETDNSAPLSSIELLKLAVYGAPQTPWALIEIPEFETRRAPIFSQVGKNELCILGGQGDRGCCSDGVVINSDDGTVSRVIPSKAERKFFCRSRSFMDGEGVLISLALF